MQDVGHYVNLDSFKATLAYRERLLSEAELQQLSDNADSNTPAEECGTMTKRICDIEDTIRGNMEALDYLRGISGLETSFTSLLEKILHAAVVLSQGNHVSRPDVIFDPEMNDKVDQCWKYIMQLTDVVQWHVTQAVRYHKFHHRLNSARLELSKLNAETNLYLEQLIQSRNEDEDRMRMVDHEIQKQLQKLVTLNRIANDLRLESHLLRPLHHRQTLRSGQHNAHALASIRLPNGAWIHRGERVRVWANSQVASELHNEWQMEALDRKTMQTTVPSFCLWLDSPEVGSMQGRRSRSVNQIEEDIDSADNSVTGGGSSNLIHSFHSDLLDGWERFTELTGRIIIPEYVALLQQITHSEDFTTQCPRKTRTLLEMMRPLIEYSQPQELNLLLEAQARPIRFGERNCSITESKLKSLTNTLNLWLELVEHLKDAKIPATQDSLNSSSNTIVMGAKTSNQTSPELTTARSSPKASTNANQPEELVTSFADASPRTFAVPAQSSHLEPHEKVISTAHAIHQSMPQNTRDVMTQITTPFLPTFIRCPGCAMSYEVSVNQSILDLSNPDWSAISPTPSAVSQPASSEHHPVYCTLTHDSASYAPVKAKSKERKGLLRLPPKRSHSQTRAEQADSSGIGSSPDPISMELGVRTEETQDSNNCPRDTKHKSSLSSFLRWHKWSKPKSAKNANSIGHVRHRHSTKSKHQSRKEYLNASEPLFRSQSWIQRGIPWGFSPPGSTEHLHKYRDSSQSGRQKRRPQSYSGRILREALRPQVHTLEYACSRDSLFKDVSQKDSFEKSVRPRLTEDAQVDTIECRGGARSRSTRTCDVCCQVGVLRCNNSVSTDWSPQSTPRLDFTRVAEVQVQPEETRWDGTTHSGKSPIASECYSVSCQVGSVARDTAVGVDALEAMQLLEQSMNSYQDTRDISVSPIYPQRKTVGKKIQVGSSWWKRDHKGTGDSNITVSDMSTSPLEGMTLCPSCSIRSFNDPSKVMFSASTLVGQLSHPVAQQTDTNELDSGQKEVISSATQAPGAIQISSSTQIGMVDGLIFEKDVSMTPSQIEDVAEGFSMLQVNGISLSSAIAKEQQTDVSLISVLLTEKPCQTSISTFGDSAHTKEPMLFSLTNGQPTLSSTVVDNAVSEILCLRTEHLCSKCGTTIGQTKVQTKSKRIQKGPPAIAKPQKLAHASSETESLTETVLRCKPAPTISTQTIPRKHLIIDIGVHQDSRSEGQSISLPDSKPTTTESSSSTETVDSIRLRFRLDGSSQRKPRRSSKRCGDPKQSIRFSSHVTSGPDFQPSVDADFPAVPSQKPKRKTKTINY